MHILGAAKTQEDVEAATWKALGNCLGPVVLPPAVVELLETGEYQARARELGTHLQRRLKALVGHGVAAVRGAGLWAGVDIDPKLGTGREVCERLMVRGVLAKDTHGSTIRFAPPLVATVEDLDLAVDALGAVLAELR